MYSNVLKDSFYELLPDTKKKIADKIFELYKEKELQYGKDLSEFSEKQILEEAVKIKAETTCSKMLALLREFFNYCVQMNAIKENPLENLIITRFLDEHYNKKIINYITHDQFLRDIEIIKKSQTGEYDAALIECLYYGIVFSTKELAHLKMGDISKENGKYYVYNKIRNNDLIPDDLYDRLEKTNLLKTLQSGEKEYQLNFSQDRIFKPTVILSSAPENEVYLNDVIRKRISATLNNKVNAKTYMRSGMLNYVINEALKRNLDFYSDYYAEESSGERTRVYEEILNNFGRDINYYNFKALYKRIV